MEQILGAKTINRQPEGLSLTGPSWGRHLEELRIRWPELIVELALDRGLTSSYSQRTSASKSVQRDRHGPCFDRPGIYVVSWPASSAAEGAFVLVGRRDAARLPRHWARRLYGAQRGGVRQRFRGGLPCALRHRGLRLAERRAGAAPGRRASARSVAHPLGPACGAAGSPTPRGLLQRDGRRNRPGPRAPV